VLGPQGRRGEVLAELRTDFPERFEQRRKLWCLAKDEGRREFELEEHWFHKGGVVLKFAGVDSISDAERLAGCELQVPSVDRSELEAGSAYVSEIVGCEVWIDNGRQNLGRVSEVQFGGGEAPLLVVQLPAMALPVPGREKEVLVPFAEEFVKKFDPAERRIEMQLPEGLLDVDAPLSNEEKQRQKQEADEARSAGEGTQRRRRDRG
jgi:16S rRNA processing protein RimM